MAADSSSPRLNIAFLPWVVVTGMGRMLSSRPVVPGRTFRFPQQVIHVIPAIPACPVRHDTHSPKSVAGVHIQPVAYRGIPPMA